MKIISRKEAKALGLTSYFTGKACVHGHASERKVSSGNCFLCLRKWFAENRETQNHKHKKWRSENPEKIREARAKWISQNRERIKLKQKEWRVKNPQCTKQKSRSRNQKSRSRNGGTRCQARKIAIKEGKDRYFTGRPCHRGHLALRATSTKHCIECRKIWAKANHEKGLGRDRVNKAKWYQENKERSKPRSRENAARWAKKNPEKSKASRQKYWLNGPENPTGEMQWLRKNQAQLRNVKRYLKNLRLGQSESSQPET